MPTRNRAGLTSPSGARGVEDEESHRRAQGRKIASRLPGSVKRFVLDLLDDMPDPTMVLEAGAAVLLHQQGELLRAYQEQVKRAQAASAEADALQASVADLEADDPHRMRVEAHAHRLRSVQPNHEGAATVIANIVDKTRKVVDSLAVHRPHDYSRVVIDLEAGGVPWSSDPGDTLHADSTQEDDELAARVLGTDNGDS